MTLAAPLASERGTSVVEALVALLLTALLVQLTWSVVLFGRRAATGLLERSEALDTERVGWHVVSAELGAGIAHRDFGLPAGGVLPLRAFRGTAEVCPALRTADGGVVLYRGMRLPDAAKDSLLHGVELIEQKLRRALETSGLERIAAENALFDPNSMEAIMTVPAATPEEERAHEAMLAAMAKKGQPIWRELEQQARPESAAA